MPVVFSTLPVIASLLLWPGLAQAKTPRNAPAKPCQDKLGDDEPARIARAYLKALDGSAPRDARAYLLGDVTLDAELATIPNWALDKREPLQHEQANLVEAIAAMRRLDRSGRAALDKLLNQPSKEGFAEVGRGEAEQIMAPTKAEAERFKKAFPVFSYMARVDKEVYWNPKNPWRKLIEKLGKTGSYSIDYHRFNIRETDHGKTRVWPLRVLRVKTRSFDSGWKILPASDWDPES